jgi:predicted metalloprotease
MAGKSLTEGLNIPDKKSGKEKSSSGGGEGKLTGGKIAFLVVAFLIGGFGVAYSMGFNPFEKKAVHKGQVVSPQGTGMSEQGRKREEDMQKKMQLPDGHPDKPVIGAS